MPAIKGDMYINTHCIYSQPVSIKLDNENIGGHLTPLQFCILYFICIFLLLLPTWRIKLMMMMIIYEL